MLADKRVENLRRWFSAVNKKDLHAIDLLADEIYTPDFIEHDPGMPDFEPGLAGLKKGSTKSWVEIPT